MPRITLTCDKDTIAGFDIKTRPANKAEMVELLKSIVWLLEQPEVPDRDFAADVTHGGEVNHTIVLSEK